MRALLLGMLALLAPAVPLTLPRARRMAEVPVPARAAQAGRAGLLGPPPRDSLGLLRRTTLEEARHSIAALAWGSTCKPRPKASEAVT